MRVADKIAPDVGAVVVDGDGGPRCSPAKRIRRIVVLAFDLHDSDLPLQVAFPLLLSNIVGHLAPGSGASRSAGARPAAGLAGRSQHHSRAPDPAGWCSGAPGGRERQAIYADTDTLGAYVVEQFLGDKLVARQRFAVNLFSKEESTITPRPS